VEAIEKTDRNDRKTVENTQKQAKALTGAIPANALFHKEKIRFTAPDDFVRKREGGAKSGIDYYRRNRYNIPKRDIFRINPRRGG